MARGPLGDEAIAGRMGQRWTGGVMAWNRKISGQELARILTEHRQWLDSGGKKGDRAKLHGAHLSRAHLSDAALSFAVLRLADLSEANLSFASLYQVAF